MGKPQTAEVSAAKAALESRFPRLRLVNLETNVESTFATFSIAGSGEDLIEAGLLTQCMIDALPRCGVKNFGSRDPYCTGIYCTVNRIDGGFRVRAYVDEADLFGVFVRLREAFGLKSKHFEGGAAFSALFPGLQIIRDPWQDGAALRVYIAGRETEDFVRAGFATQAMFDAVAGDDPNEYNEHFFRFPDEHSETTLERLLGGQGYRLDACLGRDAQGVGETVHKLFLKKREPVTAADYLQAAAVPMTNLFELTAHFPPKLAMEVRGRLASIKDLLGKEITRLGSLPRPQHLRLVVDRTSAVRP